MPAWWGKKSNKHKEDNNNNTINNQNERVSNSPKKPKDSDLLSRGSPRLSRDFGAAAAAAGGGGSSATTRFDSEGISGRGHPLPMPSTPSSVNNEHGVGFGSGYASGSVSSVGSSGSSEDHPIGHDNGQFGGGCVLRAHNNSNTTARARSPGPCCRGPTSPTSPLHPMLSGMSTDSPGSQRHRLPLPPGSPTSPPTVPPPGTVAPPSKWKKGKLLGRGSFGHVYIGFNSEGGQMCAIKEVRLVSDDHSSRESLKQLHQEIHLLSQLSHPNIVRYHGSELVDGTLSVYLEYVSGGSIHKLLQDYGSFKEPVIQNYTRQILSGLAYLHGINTVHRDIKGANILVDPNGEIKLADFGMAKLITNCSSMLSFKGSPYWMAPEVVMNTNGYSLAVDIWSLGCTVLEMATSKPPWSQYEGVAAIFKIGNSKDMPEIPDHLSNDAKSFVRLCLQRDPSARPTALKLLEHPFIREQTTTRTVNTTITRDAFPFAFDGSRTPPILESVVAPPSRCIRSNPRENNSSRAITSLPVSPCSSPLRQYGAATNRNFFRSPPHPSFAVVGQNGYNMGTNDYSQNGYSSYPLRSINTSYTLDPFRDAPLLNKAHTPPGGSPRIRPI